VTHHFYTPPVTVYVNEPKFSGKYFLVDSADFCRLSQNRENLISPAALCAMTNPKEGHDEWARKQFAHS
jgi:hypothetical protein